MSENRNQKRNRKRLQLRYGPDAPVRMGFTEDLSTDGLFIRTSAIHPPDTDLRIELRTPANESVLMLGEVRWSRSASPALRMAKGGMGVRITQFMDGEAAYRDLCEGLNARK